MRIENIVDIKMKNTRNIIDAIRFSPHITKRDIMQRLALSFATVSNICKELRGAGLLEETKALDAGASVGRSPMLLSLRYDAFYIACLDLHNVSQMRVAITNLRSEILAESSFGCSASLSFEAFVALLKTEVQRCFAHSQMDMEKLIGVAVAVPAIYDQHTGNTVASLIDAIENQPLKAALEAAFGKPVYVDNETNAHAVAAMTYEETRHSQDIIYLLGSTGVGVGIISGGRLVSGSRGHGSEVCHIPIGRQDIPCALCGQKGCVESDLSTGGFLYKYQMACGGAKEAVDWPGFVYAVHTKVPEAISVVKENGRILGELASILTNLFDPDILYIGGDMADIFEEIAPIALPYIRRRSVVPGECHVQLLPDRRKDALMQGCSEQIFAKLDLLNLA